MENDAQLEWTCFSCRPPPILEEIEFRRASGVIGRGMIHTTWQDSKDPITHWRHFSATPEHGK